MNWASWLETSQIQTNKASESFERKSRALTKIRSLDHLLSETNRRLVEVRGRLSIIRKNRASFFIKQ